MKRLFLVGLMVLLLALVVAGGYPSLAARYTPSTTHHWQLLQGHDGFVICPTALQVEQLADNAVRLVCDE